MIRTRAAELRAMTVPDWLAEVVRPRAAPVPWPAMVRAALAIGVPLSVSLTVGNDPFGVLPAMGGILGSMVDTGGPYLSRVRRVGSAAVFGGAPGLAIGSAIHGAGWVAVVAIVLVAGVSGVLSMVGDVGSVTGLQLLVYTSIGIGPVGALRPVWHTAAGFLVGVLWALILILPGWLLSPYGREQRDVAGVYRTLADELRAVGTGDFPARRQALTAALDTAYDALLTTRSMAIGRNRRTARLMAALNASNPVAEAVTALGVAGTRPPPLVINIIDRLADSIRNGTPPPVLPPAWDDSPGGLALRDAMQGAVRVLAQDRPAAGQAPVRADGRPRAGARRTGLAERLLEKSGGGRLGLIFTLRLMICMGVAAVVSEVVALQRSYWVLLTVAIVLKPDFGSVFARALQRGIGTIVGAVAGAVLLILIHGPWLLIPMVVLAALLPYGRSRNYGLLSTFLTPLVVLLIDLLSPASWQLAGDRLIDTLVGCAIVLGLGFAPWPMSWYAHLPRQFAQAARDVCEYLGRALGRDGTDAPALVRLRRQTYQALGDLRTEFQRTMSEPRSMSRRASAWWPAVIGLEEVMDAATSTALAVSRGAVPPPSSAAVRQLCDALRAVSEAASDGSAPAGELAEPAEPELPDDETLKPVIEAVRALLGVLGSGQRLTTPG